VRRVATIIPDGPDAAHGAKDEEIKMLTWLMRPANAVCDHLKMTDEHERGMVRMLVNMMLVATVVFSAMCIAWVCLS
jgi:hypothetical protein